MIIVQGPDVQIPVMRWTARKLGLPDFEKYHAAGIVDGDKPIAGVVFHDFHQREHGNMISVSVAAETPVWATKRNLAKLFAYPFLTAGCQRVTTTIAANNHRAIRFNLGIGFRKEGEVRRGYDGKTNLLVLGMLKDECRWLKYLEKEHGQRVQQSAAAA